jgi:hypothetical protein
MVTWTKSPSPQTSIDPFKSDIDERLEALKENVDGSYRFLAFS